MSASIRPLIPLRFIPLAALFLILTLASTLTVGPVRAQEGVYYRVRTGGDATAVNDIYYHRLEPGSSPVAIVTGLRGYVYSMDVDQEAGKLYWTINTGIQRANLNGSGKETLVLGLSNPSRIQVAHPLGRIFWLDAAGDGRIQSAALDGTDVVTVLEPIHDAGGYGVAGFAVDTVAHRMYWEVRDDSPPHSTAYPFNGIRSANLDGSDVQDILNFDDYDMSPQWFEAKRMAIDYYRGKLHFSAWQGDHFRMNLDGSGVEHLIDQVDWDITGFAIDHVKDRLIWVGRVGHDPWPSVIGYASLDGVTVGSLFTLDMGDGYHDGVMALGFPKVITVTETGDELDAVSDDGFCDIDPGTDGLQCTLRAAIETANEDDDTDTIEFDLGSGVPVIAPYAPLPQIEQPVTIDGGSGAAIAVRLSGRNLGVKTAGLEVNSEDVAIFGLQIEGWGNEGIRLTHTNNVHIGGPHPFEGNYLFDNGVGVRIVSASTLAGPVIEGNFIGVSPDDHDVLRPNQDGGIVIEGGDLITIGGDTEDHGNLIMDGVRQIALPGRLDMRRNTIGVPQEWLSGAVAKPFRLPVDISTEGLTCSNLGGAQGPHIPQITELSRSGVTGLADPGDVVHAYRVLEIGSQKGRYFPRVVEWLDRATADGHGVFAIDLELEVGDRVVVSAESDANGVSELSQVAYPLVVIPGIGGSWIEDSDGRDLWLPDGSWDATQNESMRRMRMNVDGEPIFASSATAVLETVFGSTSMSPYGPMMEAYQDAGWNGDAANADSAANDLWRFWYDWRRALTIPHGQLLNAIGTLTNRDPSARNPSAVSCQVDLVAHSMGGVVASAYLRDDRSPTEGPRVHRFISMAAPYLGTPQVVAAHSFGYVFGLEELSVFGSGWDVDWAGMLDLTRNMSSAYLLMPSRKYYDASLVGLTGLLPDFSNRPLGTFDEVQQFLAARRLTGSGENLGLERNDRLWPAEQAWHDRIDDWRSWTGPPHIFRLVGNRPRSTHTGWFLGNRFQHEDGPRQMLGDPPRVIQYRNRLAPFHSAGDGTVSIESATLGQIGGGSTDFSGVDSDWIEEFEQYPCLHMDIVDPSKCPGAVERTIEILRRGTTVLEDGTPRLAKRGLQLSDAVKEIFYLYASAPVAVTVTDNMGRRTGSVHPDTLGKISYQIPGARFTSTGVTTVLSLPTGNDYTVIATAPREETTVQLVRMNPSGGDLLSNNLFPDHNVQTRGSLRWTISEGGDASSVEADDNGDGSYESSVRAAATVASASAAPAIPIPEPLSLHVELLTGSANPVAEIRLPDVGGAIWDWAVTTVADWIMPDVTSGNTPGTVRLTLDAATLGAGTFEDEIGLSVILGDYTLAYTIPIELGVSDAAMLSYLLVSPTGVDLLPGEQQQFSVVGIDQFGAAFAVSVNWEAEGGTIDSNGLFIAGDRGGTFEVRATDVAATGVFDTATVSVPSLTTLESETVPNEWRLHAAYPNPFSRVTTVMLDVPKSARVSLQVFDLLGRRVGLLVDGSLQPGRHRFRFDADGLGSGIYVVHAVAETFTRAMTVVMLR